MDLIDGMKAFATVVSAGSFTQAGERLGISKKLVSKYVAQLEERLGSRLLNRTTRSISLTEAGSLYYERCVQVLEDLEELELSVQTQTATPRGRLFISAPTTFGDVYLPPLIARFRDMYPDVTVDLRLNDRYVDIVDEGFDLAIRIGSLEASSLIARKLATSHLVLCASSDYLDRHGRPEHPDDLKDHGCIIDTNFRKGASWPFVVNGKPLSTTVSGTVSVNSARSARDFAVLGTGIALTPSYMVGDDIREGRLEALLEDCVGTELVIHAVYNNRNLAPKVRVFIDFLADELKRYEL